MKKKGLLVYHIVRNPDNVPNNPGSKKMALDFFHVPKEEEIDVL